MIISLNISTKVLLLQLVCYNLFFLQIHEYWDYETNSTISKNVTIARPSTTTLRRKPVYSQVFYAINITD